MSAGRRRGRKVFSWAFALLLMALAPLAGADFLDSYKQGLKAVEAGDWEAVRSNMAEAVAEQPEADPRITKRLYFRRYIPHYFLGRALFELGDCPGALEAWKTSEAQGVIQRFPEHGELAGLKETCRQRAAVLAKQVREAQEALDRAEEARELLDGLPTPGMRSFWDEGSDSLALRTARAEERLKAARQALATRGEPADPAALQQARKLAEEAGDAFGTIRQAADELLEEAVTARDSLAQSLEPLRRKAQRSLAGIAFLRPYPSSLASSAARLEALLAASESLSPATTADDLERLRENLAEAIRRLDRQAQVPPKALMTAAESFFSGRYHDVLAELDGVELRPREAKAHGHLFLGAARFALYVSDGEQDPVLLAAAREDVLSCRKADQRLQPDPMAFSPRFVEFFLAQEEAEEAEEAEAPDDR